MADNKKPTDDLLKAMEKFITTKSVVGEPVVVGDTTTFLWLMFLLEWE